MLNTYAVNQNILNNLPKSMFGLNIPPGLVIEMTYLNNSGSYTFDPMKIFQQAIKIAQKAKSKFGDEIGSQYMAVVRDITSLLQDLINKGIEGGTLNDEDYELIDLLYNNLEEAIVGNVSRRMQFNPKQ